MSERRRYGRVVEQVVIERPIETVFAFVADLTHDPQWFRGVREVRVVSTVDSGVGAEYEQVTSLFGRRFVALVRMTEYQPPHRAALVTVRSATPFTAVYTFDPLDGGRATRYTLDASVTGAGLYRAFGPIFLPLLRRATRSRLRGLKRVLES
jgi:hypothetical protein